MGGMGWFDDFHCQVQLEDGSNYTFFTNGVVLSTGYADRGASLTNQAYSSGLLQEAWENGIGDVDLAEYFNYDPNFVIDAAGIVFYITPSNRTINIPIMVASEEYFNHSDRSYERPTLEEYRDYNDCFAIFASTNYPYEVYGADLRTFVTSFSTQGAFTKEVADNIAKLPNGTDLSIANVNQYVNTTNFIPNVEWVEDLEWETRDLQFPSGNIPVPLEYNGVMIGPCAVMEDVIPGQEYAIKVVVADGGRVGTVDTAVFLKSKGITSGADLALGVSVAPEFMEDPAGNSATFTFAVTNLSYATARDVTLTNYVPICADGAWETSEPVVWNLPDLAYRESYTTNLVVDFGDAIANYDSLTVSGFVATATGDYDMSNNADDAVIYFNSVAMTNLVVTKVWEDGDDQDGLRGTTLSVSVTTNGVVYQSVDLTATENWTKTLTVPVEDKTGAKIAYGVEEPTVPSGYTPDVSGSDYDWTITNTHTPALTNLVVTKVWDDGNDQDGLRPESVSVTVTTNGVTVTTVDLKAAEDWTKTIEGLPVNASGTPIVYTVEESNVSSDYTPVVSGSDYDWTITNTHTPATTNLVVTKVWDDGDDRDGLRPESVSVTVTTNGVTATTVDLKAAEDWTKTIENLPVNASGTPIVYVVEEPSVSSGYTPDVSGSDYDWTITNTHTPATTNLVVTKVWDDGDDQDGLRPESVSVTVTTNGVTVTTVDLKAAEDWTKTLPGLPVNAAGTPIVYTVEESNVSSDYTPVVSGSDYDWTVTNTHTPATTNLVVTKVWDDGDDQDGLRPESVSVTVTTNGVTVTTVDLTAAEDWTKTIENLPVNASGTPIVYVVEEPSVSSGYTPDVSGSDYNWTITNTHTPATTNLVVTKVWDDGEDQDGGRGTSLTVSVTTNGVAYTIVELTADAEWTATLSNVPVNASGEPIAYCVEESSIPAGYVPEVSGSGYDWTITNTHLPATTNLVVTKVWNDGDDQDGIRSASVAVTVTTNGAAYQTVDLTATENWTKALEGIPVFANGSQIAYEVLEPEVPDGYTPAVSGKYYDWTITNTHTPATTNLVVTKVWDDGDDQDGLRGTTLTVTVTTNGVAYQDVDLVADESWTKTLTGLPVNASGTPIAYAVEESTVPAGYTPDVSGSDYDWTITNTHTPATTNLVVTKVWDDGDDQDGLRPESVTVSVTTNGVAFQTVDLTATDDWTATLPDLPVNASGTPIAYAVEEPTVSSDYTPVVSGSDYDWTITNTHTPAVTNLVVTKVWNDGDDQDGLRPEFVTVCVTTNGVSFQNVDLTAVEDWTKTLAGLSVNAAGTPIAYAVEESSVPSGYMPVVSGSDYDWTITNTHTPAVTNLVVVKVWDDEDDAEALRPPTVTLTLYADNAKVEDVVLSEGNGWTKTWTDMDVCKGGSPIVYEIREENVPAEYTSKVDQSGTTFTVTNTHGVGEPELQTTATWTLNRSTGLIEGVFTLKNVGNKPFAADTDYWLATSGNRPTWYLYNPTGTMPDAADYFNFTAKVRAAVVNVGNRDGALDPGESVVVDGVKMYHIKRYSPVKYLDVQENTHAGTLFQTSDQNRNFIVSDAELSAIEATWSAGSVSDVDVLEATRLNGGAAYLWNDDDGTWEVLSSDLR